MSSKEKQVLIPEYMKQFSCIGAECEDTCCNGWTINIDKNTYKKYRKLSPQKIKTDIEKSIKRNKNNSSEGYYAEFVKSHRGCPLQSEEGWCRVHSELGESYLSNTCSIFPRMYNNFDGTIEMGGSLACPEITRLALLNPGGIDFELTMMEDNSRNHGKHNINPNNEKHKLFWEIRSFAIFIIQDRRYSIENRLINLGMWINKLSSIIVQKDLNALLLNIEEYKLSLNNSELENSLNNIKPNYKLNMKISIELLEFRKLLNIQNDRYIRLLSDITEGLNLEVNSDNNFDELIPMINENYYLPYMQGREYILENYLVNDIFINCFSHDTETLFEQYNLMVLKYALIKLHLYGVAAKYKELNDDLVVNAIQAFSKCIEHNSLYLNSILELVIKQQWNSLAHMAILIKG